VLKRADSLAVEYAVSRRLLGLAIRLIRLVVVVCVSACADLPPRGVVEYSNAITDTESTVLGQVAGRSTRSGYSGVALLPAGEFAFGARSALTAKAERSIDVQYFHLHFDPAGSEFLRELRDAARRGVRVRLLVDDLHAAGTYRLLTGLAAHDGVQVRLFNPLPVRQGDVQARMWQSWYDINRFNSRMHNKLFVADNAVAIVGGRNIADEYFMRHAVANFVDLDVIVAGPVVHDLSHSFDWYWNSDLAYPMHALLPVPDPAQSRVSFDQAVDAFDSDWLRQPTADRHGQTPIAIQLEQGKLQLHAANARVYVDPPSKAAMSRALGAMRIGNWMNRDWLQSEQSGQSIALLSVMNVLTMAESDVYIVNPYIVPGQAGMAAMNAVVKRGVQARVYTNSLGSTDHLMVHVAYSRYRADLLRMGVDLYELNAESAGRGGRLGAFGKSIARMHTKVAIADRRWVAVGSANLDSRSAFSNTELTVVLDCAPLADELIQLILNDYQTSMYRLRLAEYGSMIEWLWTDADGKTKLTSEEPLIERLPTGPERLKFLVVDEDLL
jgi:putative cardiolipin synthase